MRAIPWVAFALLVACNGPLEPADLDRGPAAGPGSGTPDPGGDPADPMVDHPPVAPESDGYEDPTDWGSAELGEEWSRRLAERTVDYGAALRVASLRLRGAPPALIEIQTVALAADPALAYARSIDAWLDDPAFTEQMLSYFRDVFKMGGGDLESAPTFAAQLVVEDRSLTELFTARAGTCPTRDATTGLFVPAECDNGVAVHAGVLTNPDVMRHFDSNLAFRRVRWLQETFACSAFPAEFGEEPRDVGAEAPYTAPWPFESIAGTVTGGRIDFRDTSSVICANCHATMNHLAPLFAAFDSDGGWTDTIAVLLPSEGRPTAELGDWLPPGERTAWRMGVDVLDLPGLGLVLASDAEVARCTVARAWNWAFGKGDIVLRRTVVPESIIAPHVESFTSGGHRMKALLRDVFTSDDFVRF